MLFVLILSEEGVYLLQASLLHTLHSLYMSINKTSWKTNIFEVQILNIGIHLHILITYKSQSVYLFLRCSGELYFQVCAESVSLY